MSVHHASEKPLESPRILRLNKIRAVAFTEILRFTSAISEFAQAVGESYQALLRSLFCLSPDALTMAYRVASRLGPSHLCQLQKSPNTIHPGSFAFGRGDAGVVG